MLSFSCFNAEYNALIHPLFLANKPTFVTIKSASSNECALMCNLGNGILIILHIIIVIIVTNTWPGMYGSVCIGISGEDGELFVTPGLDGTGG